MKRQTVPVDHVLRDFVRPVPKRWQLLVELAIERIQRRTRQRMTDEQIKRLGDDLLYADPLVSREFWFCCGGKLEAVNGRLRLSLDLPLRSTCQQREENR